MKPPLDILLVESSPGDADLIRGALAASPMKTHFYVVPNGVEAMDFLNREDNYTTAPRPDLILLDLNLPGMEGHDVLAAIKTDNRFKRIPVVILTTSTADEDVIRSYNLHANCYITKPGDPDEFVRVLLSIEEFWFSIVVLPSIGAKR